MENAGRLYFTKEQLGNTPSRRCGIDANKELSYRQQAANFIQDMGQRLQVSQLCINTAIVYMHRFYAFHSFSEVHRNSLSVAALFLAAKVEEQPRKLEHVIKVAHVCLHKDAPPLDVRTDSGDQLKKDILLNKPNLRLLVVKNDSQSSYKENMVNEITNLADFLVAYLEKQFEVVAHENVLLQTLGFVLAIEHPHTYVVKVCQLVKASKDLAQTSYFMATTSLHMTTMCLQYKPTLVACVCIHLACKWSSWKIEPCSEGKEWYYYVDKSVTLELLESLTQEFITILETSPHKFRKRFMAAQKEGNCHGPKSTASDDSNGPTKHHIDGRIGIARKDTSPGPSCLSFSLCPEIEEKVPVKREASERPPSPPPKKVKAEPSHSISLESYREKREKERLELKNSEPPPPRPESRGRLPDLSSDFPDESPESPPSHGDPEPPLPRKVNHQTRESRSDVARQRDIKQDDALTNPVIDPFVLLERVRVTSEPDPAAFRTPEERAHNQRATQIVEECTQKSSADVLHTSKHKHQKHKTNSLTNSHVFPVTDARLEVSKANGSGELHVLERKPDAVVAPTDAPRHERREKHKSKHSSRSSRDKAVNNHSEPIKVKIRKDHIIHLPENGPKTAAEGQKPGIKIKLKPPVPQPPKTVTKALKIVITKDKSGSGSYSTSHRNERESRKRGHSPAGGRDSHEGNAKHSRTDHSHRNRHSDGRTGRHHHQRNDAPPEARLDSSNDLPYNTNYGEQAYYQQYYQNAYQASLVPPLPPLPLPSMRGGENPPLPPPLPPPPPPPQ